MAPDVTKTRKALAVLIPEVAFAPLAVIGAVHYADKIAPHKMRSFQEFICNHIVEPHLKFFSVYEDAMNKAHERYDERKRQERIARGEPVEEVRDRPPTHHERSEKISEVLAKGSVAFAADIAATYIGQRVLNWKWKTEIPAAKTTFAECAVHLGLIATLPKFATSKMESIHYGIAKKLRSSFGMSKESADEKAVPYTYITMPGQLASLASLAVALRSKGAAVGHSL